MSSRARFLSLGKRFNPYEVIRHLVPGYHHPLIDLHSIARLPNLLTKKLSETTTMPLGRSHPNGLSKFARRGDFPPRMSCISSPNGYEQSDFYSFLTAVEGKEVPYAF